MGFIQPTSPSRRLARTLRELIRCGLYPPGAQLPSIADLADQHQVSFAVARNALKVLVDDKTIVRRNGDGHYVMPRHTPGEDEETRRLVETLLVVYRAGASNPKIAAQLGISRWRVTRILGGEQELTPEWSQKIIEAARAVGQENSKIHTYE